MARSRPQLRETETYTATNFLRLQTTGSQDCGCLATLEHFVFIPAEGDQPADWSCQTIVDAEGMSRSDALFIAHSYAHENNIPVIYSTHSEVSASGC